MLWDTAKAKELLEQGGYTCVLVKGDGVFFSDRRGVRPLLDWLKSGTIPVGCCAADKVVGKAAAFLYVLLGVKGLYAGVISKAAVAVLEQHGIQVAFGVLEEAIRNRAGTGYCPMEQATWELTDPRQAPAAIEKALAQLNKA